MRLRHLDYCSSQEVRMGSYGGGKREEGTRAWSAFDGIKAFPSTPEALMTEIDTAIAALEYARANATLHLPSAAVEEPALAADRDRPAETEAVAVYDKRVADEAYKAACAALAAGKPDAAIRSLHVALASCPPEKTAALAKLRSILGIASSQQQKHQHRQQ